jgi:class 3 adenylate cyclase/tetratricopeptide (TPR) repeat protein
MECLNCHHVNRPGTKFCTACGMPSPALCPACGTANPPAARFCGDCGVKLATLSSPAERAHSPSRPQSKATSVSAERRQLTVMFCDLVGSTNLSARLDPEDMHDLIDIYRKSVTDAVARFDGFIAQYLGDGVLVYFGYPQAHEDDAERAVKAGLAAVVMVDGLKAQTAAQLKVRVGIATGLVVVSEQMGAGNTQLHDVVGETPNLAARLQSVAAPGEVVIAASTRRLVGGMFDCRTLGAIELKGLPQPVEVWQVLGEMAGLTRFEALHAGALSPLVGRQEETELLLRRWEQAKASEGRVVLLSGESGIGKSRIAESLLVRLEGEPHVCLRYFCSAHHTHSALHPFIAQLERAARFEPGNGGGERLDKLEALLNSTVSNVPQDLALIAELLAVPNDGRYPVLEISPQQKREMTLTALLNQLEGIAAQSPVLIVFEDAHWIDPTSLDLLDRMVACVADLPVLLVITFRSEFQPTWVGQPHVTMLPLNRVDRRDGSSIIAGVTKGKALPDSVAKQILAHADGVPLFIEELTSTLLESGLLRETPDRYVLDGPLPPLAMPTTLQDSLVARLDRLAPVKEVAQIGAVIGREFSHELIAAVAAMTPKDLDTALERLTASGLISRRGTPPNATYVFKHALVQDAAYGTLLKSRLQQLHGSIAKLLVERFPAVAEGLPEVVAHHFTESGLASDAIDYWCKAGQLASLRSARREAVRSFEEALRVIDTLPESNATLERAFEIRLELRPVLNQLGEVRPMMERLREAEALAERLNDDRRRGQICGHMTNAHSNLGELNEALETGIRGLDIARVLGDDLELRILTTSYLAQAYYLRGDYKRVVELASDNLAALPTDWVYKYFGWPAPPHFFDRFYLVMSLANLGRFAEAAQHEAEAIRLAEPTNHWNTVGLAYQAASTHQLIKGDWAKARASIERVIAVFRTGNIVIMLPYAIATSAYVLARVGEANEALIRLTEGEHLLEHHVARGIVGQRGGAYHSLGSAGLLLGRLDDARRLADGAIASSQGHDGYRAHALHLLGDIAAYSDRLDAESSETHYSQALALAAQRGMRPLVAHCHLGLGKLYRRTGKRGLHHEHLSNATTMYREMDMGFWLDQAEAEMGQLR